MRRDQDLPFAIRADDVEQLVAFVDVDGVDARRTYVLIITKRRFLDNAVLGDHGEIDFLAKISHGHYGHKLSLAR